MDISKIFLIFGISLLIYFAFLFLGFFLKEKNLKAQNLKKEEQIINATVIYYFLNIFISFWIYFMEIKFDLINNEEYLKFNKNINAMKEIKNEQLGWLEITYLSNKLRICRGDKGTLFVLRKIKSPTLFNNFKEFIKI